MCHYQGGSGSLFRICPGGTNVQRIPPPGQGLVGAVWLGTEDGPGPCLGLWAVPPEGKTGVKQTRSAICDIKDVAESSGLAAAIAGRRCSDTSPRPVSTAGWVTVRACGSEWSGACGLGSRPPTTCLFEKRNMVQGWNTVWRGAAWKCVKLKVGEVRGVESVRSERNVSKCVQMYPL